MWHIFNSSHAFLHCGETYVWILRWELKFPKNTLRPTFEIFTSLCIIHGSYWFLSVTHRPLVIVATRIILSIFARVACLLIGQTGLNSKSFETKGYFAPPKRIILKFIRSLFFSAQQACFSCSPSKHYQAGFLYIPICPLIDCSVFFWFDELHKHCRKGLVHRCFGRVGNLLTRPSQKLSF